MKAKVVLALVVTLGITIGGLVVAWYYGYLWPDYLVVFHAGSLSVPFSEVAQRFMSENPRWRVALEASGSVMAVKKITELGRTCDVIGVADYRLIPDWLMEEGYASWYAVFASNKMVIAYTEKSRYADEINETNWYLVLNRSDVVIGRSDPNLDPCGYRALLVMELAAKYYGNPAINKSLWEHEQTIIKPKMIDLIADLEAGAIDYLFSYYSEAVSKGLKYIELPDEINLGNWEYRELYASVNVTILKHGIPTVVKGWPILYGVAVPNNAPHYEQGIRFVEILLSQEGHDILERCGFVVLPKAYVPDVEEVPPQLRPYVQEFPSD